MKVFIESQFGYCRLIWMFHSSGVNNKIKHLHERSSQIVHKDNISFFEGLLKRDKSFIIHQRNIKSLVVELFKVRDRTCSMQEGGGQGAEGFCVGHKIF